MITKPRILVAGVGNIFLGDDAFGCEVAQRLAHEQWPPEVRVADFGIRGFDLAYALLDAPEVTILIDATPRGAAPGTIYTIEPDLSQMDELDAAALMVETHGMNPLKVLAMVKSMGGEFRLVLLVGCEPQFLGDENGHMGLSEPVQAAVPEAVKVVRELIADIIEPRSNAAAG